MAEQIEPENDVLNMDEGPIPEEEMDMSEALQEVLKKALINDGLARGLREAAKALDSKQAHFAVLASDIDQKDYEKLIKGLCAQHNIPLISNPSRMELGEWAGLRKIDKEGKARKVVGCSCVVVTEYGEESRGLRRVLKHIDEQNE
eukprot:TRINITY_DN136282_c0_g1_i1.p1 TRINITY_DN136282_c0_g1~~TRINITY_DN136282_c0_g1_i1.p1  ORF type:complete len:146 (-),score=55.66 TRINITY_DN136282_c0_g1_i1:191-628(-)